jgi:diketogulonate reductase-like aldo/keto reductase
LHAQVTLNNGVVMPLVGFGTAALGNITREAVLLALAAGYRLLDSAQARTCPL